MAFMTENKLLPAPRFQRTKAERSELIEKTGRLRAMGFPFRAIGKQLEIGERTAGRYFDAWIESHKREWEKNKGNTFIKLNEIFNRKIAEADRNYEKAKDEGDTNAMGGWHKMTIETVDKYMGFLKDCGFISPEALNPPITYEEDEPLALILKRQKQELMEEMRIDSKLAIPENVSKQG